MYVCVCNVRVCNVSECVCNVCVSVCVMYVCVYKNSRTYRRGVAQSMNGVVHEIDDAVADGEVHLEMLYYECSVEGVDGG